MLYSFKIQVFISVSTRNVFASVPETSKDQYYCSSFQQHEIKSQGYPSNTDSSFTYNSDDIRHCVSTSCCKNTSSGSFNHSKCSCTNNTSNQSGRSFTRYDTNSSGSYINEMKSNCMHTTSGVLQERNTENILGHYSKKHCFGKENHHPKRQINKEALQKEQQALDKIMDPLSAIRLRPIRQKTRNAVVSILEDESISLEFIQSRESISYVTEVVRISSDGIKVTVFNPNGKKGVPLQDSPLPMSSSAISYAFSALPTKLWKKYQYADKFVRLVKMKTPKVCLFVLLHIIYTTFLFMLYFLYFTRHNMT